MDAENKQPFWRGLFSETDGKPSFSRIASGGLVVVSIGWITYLVLRNKVFPDFTGLSLFIGILYGLNKVAAAVETLKS